MKDFNLSPVEWNDLHRWDKLVLNYQGVLEHYYEKDAIKQMEKKNKAKRDLEEKNAKIKDKLPKVESRGRSNG